MNHLGKLKSNFFHSLDGLKVLWREHSFRVECYVFVPLILVLSWVDISTTQRALAIVLMFLVLITEGLNTAIEIVCNRITTEIDPGIKAAKDVASAAVMLMNIALFIYICLILFWA
jgi:diacylglycerol kinase (ATP)|tara:strand:- start:131 stop:478 length:348 start_codon:yes stop_codon:yes gene_type:complete